VHLLKSQTNAKKEEDQWCTRNKIYHVFLRNFNRSFVRRSMSCQIIFNMFNERMAVHMIPIHKNRFICV